MKTICAAALVMLAAVPAFAQPRATPPSDRILVVPFENVTRDGRIFWLGEASAVLLTDDLNALGGHAITRDERREAFDRLQVPGTASLTEATVIRIGQIVGAAHVIIGTLELDGDALVVRARDIALEAGRVQNNLSERGPVADIFGTFERLARAITPPSANAAAVTIERPVPGAFENYIKGILADKTETAVSYLNAAIQAQPTFDRARLALWDVYDREGEHERALSSVLPIAPGSALASRGQFLAGLSETYLKRYDAAYATFKALADRDPSPEVMNNLGVVQMRRGAAGAQTGQATYFFDKAAAADAADPDYHFNLGYAYWESHDAQSAIYWLREAVRRDAADGDAHFVLAAALAAAGNAAEASRERELARRLSSTYAEWEKRPGPDVVPKGLERIKRDGELPHAARIDETLAGTGQRNQQDLARFYLDRGRREYAQENDRDAIADLNRVLFLSPYQADAHLLVGRIHLRGGRVHEAIDAFKISLWSAESADAHAALADAYLEAGDRDAARAEAERALALTPSLPAAQAVLDKLR